MKTIDCKINNENPIKNDKNLRLKWGVALILMLLLLLLLFVYSLRNNA